MVVDLQRWQAALEKHGVNASVYDYTKPARVGVCFDDAVYTLPMDADDHSAAESISRVTAQVRPNASFVWMGGRVCLVDIKGCTASSSWSDFHTDDEVYWYDAELDALLAALEADRV